MPAAPTRSEAEPLPKTAPPVSVPPVAPVAPSTPAAGATPKTPADPGPVAPPATKAANPKKRKLLIASLVALVLIVGGGSGLAWHFFRSEVALDQLDLHGNVDLREVNLAFNDNERIIAVLVQEGDNVKKGQLIARLDRSRLEPQVAQEEARAAAQRAVVERLHDGNRPEEIAEAQADLQSAQADAKNAHTQYQRLADIWQSSEGRAVMRQDLDNAKSALDVAEAKLAVSQKALELELAGPRKEDVAQAEAQLRADDAQAGLMRQELADTQLTAPCDAVIRSRLMEPGEMASPQTPVFSLAIVDPKWVRAYVDEPDLGKLHPGMSATVTTDSFPGRPLVGWVGFISPDAEFTPKDVQTEELRTSLVYEVRVFVKDPGDTLRLGMPATVHLSLKPSEAQPPATQGSP